MSLNTLDLVSVDGLSLEAAVHPAVGPIRLGTLVAVHGLAVDMDEGGMYMRIGERLAEAGLTVVRFSFRGHGGSTGTQRGVTIAGQMLDLQAVVEEAARDYPGRLSILAAGFGAVPTTLSLPHFGARLHGLALWNPVLDLRRTFLEPDLPWGLANFGPAAQKRLHRDGFLLVDGEFQLGRGLFDEMSELQPLAPFLASEVPALIVHGDCDTYASYDVARSAATARQACRFHTVQGSDHGFDIGGREDEAIEVTVAWLLAHRAPRL